MSGIRIGYRVELMQRDLALKGWMAADLAKGAGVSRTAVARFLDGTQQTTRMCKRLADALGQTVERYIVFEDNHDTLEPLPHQQVRA